MVVLDVYCHGDQHKAYVQPFPINQRLTFPEQERTIKILAQKLMTDQTPKVYIENNGYQDALIQSLKNNGLHAEGIRSSGEKRERLVMTTTAIQNGQIMFPRKGAEELIMQLTGFGVEKHDDLADAFSLVANQFVIYANKPIPRIYVI